MTSKALMVYLVLYLSHIAALKLVPRALTSSTALPAFSFNKNKVIANSIYPPEGVDYPIPNSDVTLQYRPVPSTVAPRILDFGHLVGACTDAQDEIRTLMSLYGSDGHFDYTTSGPAGGVFQRDKLFIKFQDPDEGTGGPITLGDAIVALTGVVHAAEDRDYDEEAKIYVKVHNLVTAICYVLAPYTTPQNSTEVSKLKT